MARLCSSQTLVRLLHALHCFLETGIAARLTAGIGAHLGNPLAQARMRWPVSGVARRRAKALNGHELLDTFRIDTAVLTGDTAAQGVPNDGNGKYLQLFEKLRHVQDIIDHGVLPTPRPLRVT